MRIEEEIKHYTTRQAV